MKKPRIEKIFSSIVHRGAGLTKKRFAPGHPAAQRDRYLWGRFVRAGVAPRG
jgi:hypothetical protein